MTVALLLLLLTAVLVLVPVGLASRRLVRVTKSLDYLPGAFVSGRGASARERFRRAVSDARLADDALRELADALFTGDPRTRVPRVNEALAELDTRIGVGVGVDGEVRHDRGVGAVVRMFVYGALLQAALAYGAGLSLRDAAVLIGVVVWAAYLWAFLERTTRRIASDLRRGLDRWVDGGLAASIDDPGHVDREAAEDRPRGPADAELPKDAAGAVTEGRSRGAGRLGRRRGAMRQ